MKNPRPKIDADRAARLRAMAAAWWNANRSPSAAHVGFILLTHEKAFGWTDTIAGPQYFQPGVMAVTAAGHIYTATGGSPEAGARRWEWMQEQPLTPAAP